MPHVLGPTHKAEAEAVERIASNFPTVFTRAIGRGMIVARKPAKTQRAPVAQVDRAAVS
jgi:hypothetical protein